MAGTASVELPPFLPSHALLSTRKTPRAPILEAVRYPSPGWLQLTHAVWIVVGRRRRTSSGEGASAPSRGGRSGGPGHGSAVRQHGEPEHARTAKMYVAHRSLPYGLTWTSSSSSCSSSFVGGAVVVTNKRPCSSTILRRLHVSWETSRSYHGAEGCDATLKIPTKGEREEGREEGRLHGGGRRVER